LGQYERCAAAQSGRSVSAGRGPREVRGTPLLKKKGEINIDMGGQERKKKEIEGESMNPTPHKGRTS